jgi:exodeoxyribonuclease VII large subunit
VIESPMPVVVGVGHESDVTLADFAADLRAPTPSAAAEQAVPDLEQFPAILDRLRDRASAAMFSGLADRGSFLGQEGRALTRLLPDTAAARQRAAELVDRGQRALSARTSRELASLQGMADALRALSPAATLERGYAVARLADGTIVRDHAQATVGGPLEVVVASGTIATRVETTAGSDEEVLQ